jgi:protein gp37
MNRWLHKGENWGPGAPRLEFSDAHWDKLNRWNDAAAKRGEHPKVFPSMCDPFDNEVRAGLRDRFWRAIQNTPSLTWLVLTKRIGNAQKMLPQAWLENDWPRNLWLGATVVNQQEADRDIPKLLATPARVRFLSIEPMLGPVFLTNLHVGFCTPLHNLGVLPSSHDHIDGLRFFGGIDWVIGGFESGHHARPGNPAWARSLRDQCAAAGTAFLWKQNGEWAPGSLFSDRIPSGECCDFDGILKTDDERVWKVGKKAAGRLLDGVEHNGFPTSNPSA